MKYSRLLYLGFVFILTLVTTAFSNSVEAAACTSSGCSERLVIANGMKVLIYRTYSPLVGDPAVTNAVIVIHGSARDAASSFSGMLSAAGLVGMTQKTAIISPFLRTNEDVSVSDDLYWTTSGWKDGSQSISPGNTVSSFSVVDHFLGLLADRTRFPNLQVITIVGHSAGGQFTQRYAVGNRIQFLMRDYKFSYVVTNPSSYMYLDSRRPVSGSIVNFSVPTSCSGHNNYKYGHNLRNTYMNRVSSSVLNEQYLARYVTYLAGEADTSRTNDLDISCSGDIQGIDRITRARGYANFIETFYPDNQHAILTVAGVGHSSSGMFRSSNGLSVIFPNPADIPDAGPDRAIASLPSPTPTPTATPSPTPTPAPPVAVDSIAPIVNILSPASGTSVSSSVSVMVSASDNIRLQSISCSVNGSVFSSMSYSLGEASANYSCVWNINRKVAAGIYTITAVARDASGNSSQRAISVTVTVASKGRK